MRFSLELAWARLREGVENAIEERYGLTTGPEAADEASTVDAVTQPINCLQCENAPCEQVCWLR